MRYFYQQSGKVPEKLNRIQRFRAGCPAAAAALSLVPQTVKEQGFIQQPGPPPLVSVIVPAYNAERTIQTCLSKLLAQDYPRLEVIVVADCCSDNTTALIPESVRVVYTEERSGAAAARNLGAREARGDILIFVDSDIAAPLHAVSTVVNNLLNVPGVLAACASYSENSRHLGFVSDYKNLDLAYRTLLLPDCRLRYASSFFLAVRASTLREVHGFSNKFAAASAEDIDFLYRIGEGKGDGRVVHMDRTLQVDHLKAYTLGSMLRTNCARIFTMLAIIAASHGRHRAGEHIPGMFYANAVLSPLIILSLFVPSAGSSTVLLLVIFAANNAKYMSFLRKRRGILFALRSLVLLFIEYTAVAVVLLAGVALVAARSFKRMPIEQRA